MSVDINEKQSRQHLAGNMKHNEEKECDTQLPDVCNETTSAVVGQDFVNVVNVVNDRSFVSPPSIAQKKKYALRKAPRAKKVKLIPIVSEKTVSDYVCPDKHLEKIKETFLENEICMEDNIEESVELHVAATETGERKKQRKRSRVALASSERLEGKACDEKADAGQLTSIGSVHNTDEVSEENPKEKGENNHQDRKDQTDTTDKADPATTDKADQAKKKKKKSKQQMTLIEKNPPGETDDCVVKDAVTFQSTENSKDSESPMGKEPQEPLDAPQNVEKEQKKESSRQKKPKNIIRITVHEINESKGSKGSGKKSADRSDTKEKKRRQKLLDTTADKQDKQNENENIETLKEKKSGPVCISENVVPDAGKHMKKISGEKLVAIEMASTTKISGRGKEAKDNGNGKGKGKCKGNENNDDDSSEYTDTDGSDDDSDDDSEDPFYDEEEEYIKSIGEDKAADLFELQEKLYSLGPGKVPLRFQILQSNHPDIIKTRLLKMLDSTYDMGSSGEYSKTLKFIEGALDLPLSRYIDDKVQTDQMGAFLTEAKDTLDAAVYGHSECKEYILQIIAQYMAKGDSRGKVFGIQGPPGNGKTSLVRNGVCKVLKRPFTMIALGGISDGSLMEGHDFTYEGSMWGKLAQCLMDAKCMNPVIYFDELDKISKTHHGEEIVGILTHLVDFSQNDCIRDRYFNGIDLDYSRCIFVFSFNDESAINPVLKDRIQIFHTKGFGDEEKITIAQKYLLPDICKDYTFDASAIVASRDILQHIICRFVGQQEGVRNLKRKLELLVLRLNYSTLLSGQVIDQLNPYILTREYVDQTLSAFKGNETPFSSIYM